MPHHRRTFLKNMSAAATTSLAARAWANEGPDLADKPRYRVAVIGSTGRGNYGHRVDVAWKSLSQTEVVAVADDDPEGLAAAAKRLKVDQAFADYRRMIDTVKPDIVAVCPRWVDQHRDMAVHAANADAHIYMEKPFCRDLVEADQIVAACRANNVKLALAHPTRYSPVLHTVKRLIEQGAIGRVLELRGRGKEDRRGGAEDLWVLGTHLFDMILAFGYTPQWCFATVRQDGQPIRAEHVIDGAEGLGPLAGDTIHAMYGLNGGGGVGGVTATIQTTRKAEGDLTRYGLRVYGSEGVIEILEGPMAEAHILQDASWSPARSGKQWRRVSSAGIDQPEPLTDTKYTERHRMAIEELLASIEQDRQPSGSAEDGRHIIEMTAAVFESQRVGGPVEFPLKTRVNPLTLF
jgi:predicted dehydrogenase